MGDFLVKIDPKLPLSQKEEERVRSGVWEGEKRDDLFVKTYIIYTTYNCKKIIDRSFLFICHNLYKKIKNIRI